MENIYETVPQIMEEHVSAYERRMAGNPKLAKLYRNCYLSTWKSALKPCPDGTCFVLTGDIPAMWLRDSSAQVNHYLKLCGSEGTTKSEAGCAGANEVSEMLKAVLRRQFMYIGKDPYANSFNEEPNGHGHTSDIPTPGPWVWECKYEIDSLCYPVCLLYRYYRKTGDIKFVSELLPKGAETILGVWRTEQHHTEKSPYRFTRPNPGKPWSTIYNGGMGSPVVYTGMTWSGFRPSDDGCEYGYLISSNMFAVVTLGYMAEMLRELENFANADTIRQLISEAEELRSEIDAAIRRYGIVEHEKYGRIYVCETDGMGHYNLLDDANIPSLLSAPYIGYLGADDEIYCNTRRFLLSSDNPYYFEGKYARGIGSRHTPEGYIWHMALIMQGLTSKDSTEKKAVLDMLVNSDAGTGHMHESFHADDPGRFTREWFTWPEALFAEFAEMCVDEGIID